MRPLRLGEEQWIFTADQLSQTPSRLDGISFDDELEGRKRTIIFMRSLWLRVAAVLHENDPEVTAAKGVMTVGAVLVHRFFMRRSLNDFSPKTMAPTILFLASKVEESPLRLRHIVNATLAKFEPTAPLWEPKDKEDVPQPMEYRRWEREILATEEVALEALCFDMAVDQPWPILRRAVRGIDNLWADPEPEASTSNGSAQANGGRKGKHRATEAVITELGWAMLNEGYLAPLGIVYRPEITAFAVFVQQLAILEEIPLPEALWAAAELAGRFGLNIEWNEGGPPVGPSTEGEEGSEVNVESVEQTRAVMQAINDYMSYCSKGIIDDGLPAYIDTTDVAPLSPQIKFTRKFKLEAAPPTQADANGTLNGEAAASQ